MKQLEYTVPPEREGAEVLTLLRQYGLSSGMIRRLKRTGGLLLDGQEVTVRGRVSAGQRLTLRLPETPSRAVEPVPMDLKIVYENDRLLVVDKPAGMPVHPSAGHHGDSLANGVAAYMHDPAFTFRPITRLDRYTSGLTLIAKDAPAAAVLCRQIQQGVIRKTYYAITEGIPNPPAGRVEYPIGRVPGSVIARQVTRQGKPAVTEYQVMQVWGNRALVRLHPITGRTHQLRVHMAAIGCPLLYDFLYGREQPEKSFFLRCTGLTFDDPDTGEKNMIEIQYNFPVF